MFHLCFLKEPWTIREISGDTALSVKRAWIGDDEIDSLLNVGVGPRSPILLLNSVTIFTD
jgi:hypothetical protein